MALEILTKIYLFVGAAVVLKIVANLIRKKKTQQREEPALAIDLYKTEGMMREHITTEETKDRQAIKATGKTGDMLEIDVALHYGTGPAIPPDKYETSVTRPPHRTHLWEDTKTKTPHAYAYRTKAEEGQKLYEIHATFNEKQLSRQLYLTGKNKIPERYRIDATPKEAPAGKKCRFRVELKDKEGGRPQVTKMEFKPVEGSTSIGRRELPAWPDLLHGPLKMPAENTLNNVKEGANKIKIKATLTDGTAINGKIIITGTMEQKLESLLSGTCEEDTVYEESLQGAETAKNIAALLNSNGGSLLLGVRKKTGKPSLTGIKEDMKKLSCRTTAAYTHAILERAITPHFPPSVSNNLNGYVNATFHREKGETICWLKVKKSNVPVFLTYGGDDSRFYIRSDGQTAELEKSYARRYCEHRFNRR